MNSEKVFLEWNWVDQQVMALGETIKDSVSEYSYITGIPRGGLIPGVYLSHYIGIKYLPYDNAKELPLSRRKEILAVDDICDSGITLIEASGYGFHTAALALRYSSSFMPDWYSKRITDDSWLVFPWERDDSKPIQDYLDIKE